MRALARHIPDLSSSRVRRKIPSSESMLHLRFFQEKSGCGGRATNWWKVVVDDINDDDADESASVLVPFAVVIVIVFSLFSLLSPSGRTDGARPRPRFYDGFQVIYDPGVPRVPTNGFTLYREQLREGDQLVLEHHEFDDAKACSITISRFCFCPNTKGYIGARLGDSKSHYESFGDVSSCD
ncbi:hypothetical protein V1478_016597 [Vespula squamosa]|uniref:Uncharacterized protein n=1 Tax=Vespula squamosa TaxID=30214 RepID=A0ABD2A2M3_VESSQ